MTRTISLVALDLSVPVVMPAFPSKWDGRCILWVNEVEALWAPLTESPEHSAWRIRHLRSEIEEWLACREEGLLTLPPCDGLLE